MLNFKKIRIDREDLFLSFVIVFFILFSIIIPMYGNVNGFHNLIFDNYKLTWYDGRSPANFYITKNLLENKSIFFPRGYLIGDIPVENLFDFVQKDGNFFPMYNFLGNYVYAGILYFIPFSSALNLFKAMIFINIIFSAILLLIFYYTQRLLGLKIKFALLSTLVAGLATSVLIYSRYLFIEHTFLSLFLISLIYVLLKFRKKTSLKIEMLACIIFSLFLIFLWNEALVLIFFAVFPYIFIKYKFLRFGKILIIPLFVVCIILVSIELLYTGGNIAYRDYSSGIKEIVEVAYVPVFRIFPKYINALDYSVFGYHNLTSVWKLDRQFGYIYAFEELKGNAIFLRFYSVFGSLFGPKGIIYNSPFLIFSIFGIFLYNDRKKKNLLLISIILIIISYGLLHTMWYGGVTPRYNRFFTIPILFLTFFSFYYIQETKNNLAKWVFIILVILSVLNVTSLAVRADWNYEHEVDLVSYDLVLWPWYPSQNVERTDKGMTIYLTSTEISNWKLGGEEECKAKFTGYAGLETDPCNCVYNSWAEREIYLDRNISNIEIKACATLAGNDGTKGFVYIDNELIGGIFVNSYSCDSKSLSVNISSGEHMIKLMSGKYEKCDGEMVFWKSISLE